MKSRLTATLSALLYVGVFLIIGCEPSENPHPEIQPTNVAPAPSAALPASDTAAREKLKTALDAWTFGDGFQKFKHDHPDIDFLEFLSLDRRGTLLRYDIGASRSDGTPNGYEFAVTLTFVGPTGAEEKSTRRYMVHPKAGGKQWFIANRQN